MPEGKVVTFYSYKGGTGRTMALANTAWILASNGYKVLVVDWDLDSPGLHKFYRPFLDRAKVSARSDAASAWASDWLRWSRGACSRRTTAGSTPALTPDP